MRGLNQISITARCALHHGKVIYLTPEEAEAYGHLNRIRYGGPRQTPYRCPVTVDKGREAWHWHVHHNRSGAERKQLRFFRKAVADWENEGGAT